MKRLTVAVALFSSAAFAQSALTITCSDCIAFQSIEVSVDGKPINAGPGRTNVRTLLKPGKHEVRVAKLSGRDGREELPPQVLKFEKGSELRLNARQSTLEVYGTEKLTVWPSQRAVNEAAGLIAQADGELKNAAAYNEERGSTCQEKVAGRLERIGDDIEVLKRNVDVVRLHRTAEEANGAKWLIAARCPKKVQNTLGKRVGRLVARLDRATTVLRQ